MKLRCALEVRHARFSLAVDETVDLRGVIASAGGRLPAERKPWEWRGQVHADAIDPEGNVFQLRQPKERCQETR